MPDPNFPFIQQLFWCILIVVGFIAALVVPTAIYEAWRRREYTKLCQKEQVRKRWTEMVEQDAKHYDWPAVPNQDA